ncbi:TPA: protein tyrosine phosphatase [Corynebacterium striatum]|nr:protein tyrosine phosphatase [Corynebacterium striatum]
MTHLNDHRLATLRQDLHDLYGNAHAAAEIDAEVDAAIARHTAGATVEEFIPVLVEREVKEYFGEHRLHVRFSAGAKQALAQEVVELAKKYAGDALLVDAAAPHEEADPEGRMVAMPDFIVYLGRDIPRDEAGKDIKIWDIAEANTEEEKRELHDDLEARVLYMLNRLGIDPVQERTTVGV